MTQAARALAYALETATLAPPSPARGFFLRAEAIPIPLFDAEQSFRPAFLRLSQTGRSVTARLEEGRYPFGLVLLTKHKEENFANMARGWALLAEGGRLICAGANDDGAASQEKHAGRALGLSGSLVKFHCRVFWLEKADQMPPDYWRSLTALRPVGDGAWVSQPGIFSWDRIDDGSALLAQCLPKTLKGHVADFGCGWGYLARELLGRATGIERIDLIDAEHRAIEAARVNIDDPRASIHWLDIVTEVPPSLYDAIVCNPPFHAGRAVEPALGQGFIEAAARALRPGGRLFLVANKGLPYEPILRARFTSIALLADNNKFRVWEGVR